jgi:hypothetical protein
MFERDMRADFWSSKFSILNILVALIGISITLALAKPLLGMAFLWVFQFVFFGIGALLIQLDPFPHYLSLIPSRNELHFASQITFIANCFVLLAELIAIRKNTPISLVNKNRDPLNYSILLQRSYRTLLVYFVTLPVILNQLGGISFLFKRIRISQIGEVLPISLNAIFLSILYVPPLIVTLILLYLRETIDTSDWIFRLLMFWVLILSNPLGNARQTTLFLILPLAFYYLNKWRRLTLYFFVFLTLFFIYSAGLVNRYTGKIQIPEFSIISRSGDFDAFAQLANGLKVVTYGIFPIFEQVLGSLFFFVPRSLWSGKPFDTGVEVAQTLSLKFQNLSAPWILESYANARIFGVIAVSIFIGYKLTSLEISSGNNIKYFLLSSMTTGFLFIILRGSLLQATGRAAFSIVMVYFLLRGLMRNEIKNSPKTHNL